jgi:hypothetical protein
MKSTIVAAAGTANGLPGSSLAKVLEQAMSDAVTQAYADGITDPDEVLALKLAAKDKAKAEYLAERDGE